MKWFLSVCALLGGIGIVVASCGPQKDFCPTTNPNPTDLTCHDNNEAGAMGGTGGGLCDGGTEFICAGVHQCTPC